MPMASIHSLVAIATACQSVASYQCDMALAGGITIVLPQKKGYFYKEGGMLSPDGHCRTFDENAAGTVFSNGAAVVLLKPQGRWAMARTVWRAALGQLEQDSAVLSLACAELTVSPSGWRKGRVKVAFDGERERMDAPLCFKLHPRPLWLVAPTRLERTPASPVEPLPAATGVTPSLVTA